MPADPARLRVLHLTAGSEAGGVSRYLIDLSLAMRDVGHEVVIAGRRGADHQLFEDAGLAWIDQPLDQHPGRLLTAARSLERYLRGYPVDLIHAHYRRSALVGRRLASRLNLPLLFTLHGTGIPMRGVWRWASDFGDRTHAPSAQARQWLIQTAKVPPARIQVIPHGINPDRYPIPTPEQRTRAREQLGLPGSRTIAAYIGRFDDPKNEGWVIDLADAARTSRPEAHFVLMGRGPHEPELRRRIDQAGLEDRVTLVPYGDPGVLYPAIDLLLLPSAREGFSLVCAEAMAAGRAVLRTRTAGTEEMIVEGVTGRSVPVDSRAFIQAATAMLGDPAALGGMGRQAAEHVRTHLQFDTQLARTEALYRSMSRG